MLQETASEEAVSQPREEGVSIGARKPLVTYVT